jgi:hypothetical protein
LTGSHLSARSNNETFGIVNYGGWDVSGVFDGGWETCSGFGEETYCRGKDKKLQEFVGKFLDVRKPFESQK